MKEKFFTGMLARSSNVFTFKTNTTKWFYDKHHRMIL